MQTHLIKQAIKAKSLEFDIATRFGKPREELLKIYKEIKVLQFQLIAINVEKKAN